MKANAFGYLALLLSLAWGISACTTDVVEFATKSGRSEAGVDALPPNCEVDSQKRCVYCKDPQTGVKTSDCDELYCKPPDAHGCKHCIFESAPSAHCKICPEFDNCYGTKKKP